MGVYAPLASLLARKQDLIALNTWALQLRLNAMHRKAWEFAYIAQALFERSMLQSGKRGIGFAVGTEPLPALFAKYGACIVATDLGEADPGAANWKKSNQHAADLSALARPDICDDAAFYNNVSYMPLDMNDILSLCELSGFDFCWSACALEHIGDIEQGREFILNTLALLKPNGVSVHTTEYNLSSAGSVQTAYGNVFGRTFFEELRDFVMVRGHYFTPLDLRLGTSAEDDYIYKWEGAQPHFKLMLDDVLATSIGFMIIKGDNKQR